MKPEFTRLLPCAALVLLAALTLSACNSGSKSNSKATAGGQVLEGSVSDAMLPVDRVRSQPPLAEKTDDGSGFDGKSASRGKGSSGALQADASADAGTAADAPEPSGASDTAAGPTPGAE